VEIYRYKIDNIPAAYRTIPGPKRSRKKHHNKISNNEAKKKLKYHNKI